jgi:hypothetical protein
VGSFMMCPPGHLTGNAIEDGELGRTDDSLGREDK